MSFLNILVWIIGALLVCIYLFFQIRKYLKWKKVFNAEMEKDGMTIEQAKKTANEQVYKKKKRKSKTEQEVEDIIYKD